MGADAKEVFPLGRDERVNAYMQLAIQAEDWAVHARTPEVQNGYLELAAGWRKLANDITAWNSSAIPTTPTLELSPPSSAPLAR